MQFFFLIKIQNNLGTIDISRALVTSTNSILISLLFPPKNKN